MSVRLSAVAAPAGRFVLAAILALLALYGCWSWPGLAARWGVSGPGLAVLAGWSLVVAWALGMAVRRPGTIEVAGFGAVALALRLASLWLSAGRVSPGDPEQYLLLARHLIAGQGMMVVEPYMREAVWAFYPPVYPLLLAGWGAMFGLTAPAVLALSTLVDLGAAALIARLGARLGEVRAGLAAAALYLIWPATLLNAPLAQKEGLQVLLIAALALGWLAAERGFAWRKVLAIGVPAGLLALTQPGQAALAGLFGIALLPRIGWRRLIGVGVPAAAVALLVMTPWWARNWLVFGAFVPLTSAGGLSLWVGENPDATGSWLPYPPELAGRPELAYGKAAGHMATQWMATHPLGVLRLNATKFFRAGGVAVFGLTRLAAMQPPLSAALGAALLPLVQASHVALLGAGALATALCRDSAARTRALLLAACLVQLLVFGIWFEFGERHREFVTPFVLLGVAMAVRGVVAGRVSAPDLPRPA